MKQGVSLLIMLSALSCSAESPGSYLACIGASGVSDNQSALPLVSRSIATAKDNIKGSIHIGANEVIVEGIPYMAGTYKICQDSDQALWFSPSGDKSFCAGNDAQNDLGMLNKVTGEVRYHVGDALFILSCKKAEKMVR